MSSDKATGDELKQLARKVLHESFYGVLSTHSLKFPGYPFGSVVPYCLDYQGKPLILISRLAQHTQNIQQDNKVSVVIMERAGGNVQTDARLTLLANVEPVAKEQVEAAASRYYRYFPAAKGYHLELDFEFYCLEIDTIRFIPGFGQARWLSPSDVLQANPFTQAEEERIVNHMNEDHQDALLHYYQSAPIANKGTPAEMAMAAIDAEGIVLRNGEDLYRIDFRQPVSNPVEARQALVEMAST